MKRWSFDRISTLRQLSVSFCKPSRDCCLLFFWHQESYPDSFLILPSSQVFPKASTGDEAAGSIFIARLYGSRVVLTRAPFRGPAADHLWRDSLPHQPPSPPGLLYLRLISVDSGDASTRKIPRRDRTLLRCCFPPDSRPLMYILISLRVPPPPPENRFAYCFCSSIRENK